ncbi:hypothetical protein SODALDRAFT_333001 [Sodiomyces alkalinus F11]|uniref:Protein kinase domain-containing protein n=1 Tax=Sodiomyces alkalinus (strain CBS 110278 / VKM F-3762 / F11) TaxID=1314773 RepID=A0A3N2PVC2_SODAK|nr:hypothetical protein SODALDRAFT_333001 [Sodiomyces alkalinus F11]ROT38428.1 hypothetical protein SODALDRAFT_333001 [Sodiomyces alkalinus F11]
MSTTEELKRLLEQAKAQAEKAESRIQHAEARIQHAEARAQKAESLTRNTTIQEYLQACHEHVLSKIVLDTRGYVTSKVPTTDPTGKHCPDLLTPWKEFRDTQADIIEKLRLILPSDERLFENIASLKTIGERINKRHVRNEPSLVFIENNCVEDPVRIILDQLKRFQPGQHGLSVYDGVIFETTANNLRDETDGRDTTKRDEKLRTDQICVLRNTDGQSEIAYVIEYKAPHKLHTSHLDLGLRPMSIFDQVVNKPTVPTDAMPENDRMQHYAELLSTAAVTQTYHYMLEAGLEYGYLANGDSFVFLKIDWDNPKELFYHLAYPAYEVEANHDLVWSNAVCQVLAFTLLALQTTQHDNDERNAATTTSKKWRVDFEAMVDRIIRMEEEEEAKAHGPSTPTNKRHRRVPSSPDWKPGRGKKARTNPDADTCQGPGPVLRSHSRREGGGEGGSSGGGSSQGGAGGASTSSRPAPVSGSGGSSSTTTPKTGSGGRTRSEQQPRAYCTPSCLLSLVNGGPLDDKCPNVSFHKKGGTQGHHPVSHARWTELLRQQLSKTLVKGVVALNQQGGCGVLFQLTLLEYGYTFVAKGVTGRRVPDLQKEETVYRKLQPLQGRYIPVCLGSVNLRLLQQTLFYDIDVRLIYFLLLSYGGAKLAKPVDDPKAQARIVNTVTAAVREMHSLGVAHGDIRLPNVLQGPGEQVTIVDFDQALLFPTGRGAMSAISHNKRRRLMETDETPLSKSAEVWLYNVKTEDMSNAECLFTFDAAAGRRI